MCAEKATSVSSGSQGEERESWGNRVEFLLSCVGYAVGLGNVWRFPYICYKSGGGAFLIPFTFFLLVAGIPLFFLELSLGQYGRSGPITVWRCAPLFTGIGYCMCLVCFVVSLYYNVIISWCVFYLYHSFTLQPLPWASCHNPWNTDSCVLHTSPPMPVSCRDPLSNSTSAGCNVTKHPKSAAEEFYYNNVLGISAGIEQWGSFQPHLVLCLLLAWVLVYAVLYKGIQSLGKVSYFTAVFPYFLLSALLVMALTLPGSWDGILFYIRPEWGRLLEPAVWKDAAGQVFFSFGISWGCLIAFSSYNNVHNNCLRDAVIVSLLDWLTSLFAGFVIFAVLGFMAHQQGTAISEAVSEGPGLAFMAYPTIVTKLPLPQLWSALFFAMLVILGCDTQFAIVESVVTGLSDRFPSVLRRHKSLTTLALCCVWFVLGLTMCTSGGLFILVLLDTYAAGVNLLIVGIAELLVMSWAYGGTRLSEDIEFMIGRPVSRLWPTMWAFVTPFALAFVLVVSLLDYSRPSVAGQVFPIWADCIGWSLVLISTSLIPITALVNIIQSQDTSTSLAENIKFLLKPDETWGPTERREKKIFVEDKLDHYV